jgi:nucleoside-diphosphate-sugar epimerase
MKVFLTGATGYVGQVVLDRLLRHGHSVDALVRSIADRTLPAHRSLNWIVGDLRNVSLLADAAKSADATIHTAAEHSGAQKEADDTATAAFVDGLRGSGKPLISTSATVVYGDTGPTPRNEADAIRSPHPLRAWRIANDNSIALDDHGFRGVVIRPPNIYGAGAGPIAMRIAAAAKAGFAQYIGDGGALWSTVHVWDLADLYLAILANERAYGIFNAAGDEVLSRKQLAEGMAATLGLSVSPRSISLDEGRLIWGFLADLSLINQVISATKAREELGWAPRRRPLMSYLRERDYGNEGIAES